MFRESFEYWQTVIWHLQQDNKQKLKAANGKKTTRLHLRKVEFMTECDGTNYDSIYRMVTKSEVIDVKGKLEISK